MSSYAGQTIKQLRTVAIGAIRTSNAEILLDLEKEMQTRIDKRIGQGKTPTKEQKKFLDEIKQGMVSDPIAGPGPDVGSELPSKELDRLRNEVRFWRSLYSESSESLARWGLTDELPVDLLDHIVELWRARLSDGQVDGIRTIARFETDIAVAREALGRGRSK